MNPICEVLTWKPIDRANKDATHYILGVEGLNGGLPGYYNKQQKTWKSFTSDGKQFPVGPTHFAEVKGPRS